MMHETIASQIQSFFDHVVSSTDKDIQTALNIRTVNGVLGSQQYGQIAFVPYEDKKKENVLAFHKKTSLFGTTTYSVSISDPEATHEKKTITLETHGESQKLTYSYKGFTSNITSNNKDSVYSTIREMLVNMHGITFHVAPGKPITMDEKTWCAAIERVFSTARENTFSVQKKENADDKTYILLLPKSTNSPQVRLIHTEHNHDEYNKYAIEFLDHHDVPIYNLSAHIEVLDNFDIEMKMGITLQHNGKDVRVPSDQFDAVLDTLKPASMLFGVLQHLRELQNANQAKKQQDQTERIDVVALALKETTQRLQEINTPSM